MSRLSEILGVPEGREFKFDNGDGYIYKILDDKRFYKSPTGWVRTSNETALCTMIAHLELIKLIPEKPTLTDKQITAIKGRLAEGTPWATRDKGDNSVCLWEEKPICNEGCFSGVFSSNTWCSLYDFITFENSPVYLPDLIEGSEGE